MTIIIALILSVYSFTVIDGLNAATDDDEDARAILLRTEGREADHICSAGGADILIGNDSNNNGILEEDEVTSTPDYAMVTLATPGRLAQRVLQDLLEKGYTVLLIQRLVENGNETLCIWRNTNFYWPRHQPRWQFGDK